MIQEIHKDRIKEYKSFFIRGLREHPENFRIIPEDEFHSPFPTLSRPDSFTLAALNDQTWMGVISFQREGENRIKLQHKGLLFRMYVAREFSGMGIGKWLIRELILRAQSLPGLEQINLTLATSNSAARGLYSGFGFEAWGIEKNAHKYGDHYTDEENMVLYLNKA